MSVFTQHVIDQVDSREEIASVKRLAYSEGGGPSVQTAPILELLTIPRGNQGWKQWCKSKCCAFFERYFQRKYQLQIFNSWHVIKEKLLEHLERPSHQAKNVYFSPSSLSTALKNYERKVICSLIHPPHFAFKNVCNASQESCLVDFGLG